MSGMLFSRWFRANRRTVRIFDSMILDSSLARARSRQDLWVTFINGNAIRDVAEIGVYRGEFAATLLEHCPDIRRYYMVDPWRHLDDWNKPANRDDATFEQYYEETLERTRFAAHKRMILRGRTVDVIGDIPDESLDLAYIDGDHTLKGITIDLINVYPKVRSGGIIAGDDFSCTIWQHDRRFEPTLVFPFAVYFAEAVASRIYALPFNQFLIHKTEQPRFEFIDLTQCYRDTTLRKQFIGES